MYNVYVLYVYTIRKVNYIHNIHVNVDKVRCRTFRGSKKTVNSEQE